MTIEYKKGTKLSWEHLWGELGLTRDNGGRWHATQGIAKKYIDENEYRSPSRAWPHSHAKPLLTQKFAKYLTQCEPDTAIKLGVAERVE